MATKTFIFDTKINSTIKYPNESYKTNHAMSEWYATIQSYICTLNTIHSTQIQTDKE